MRRAGHVAAGAVAVLAALTLSGCGEVSPGAAATVDGEAIPLGRVDAMAQAFCAAEIVVQERGGNPPMFETTAGYRIEVLTTLVNVELAEDVVAELGIEVPPSAYQTDLGQLGEQFPELSAADVTALRDYIDELTRLLGYTTAIGREQQDATVSRDPAGAIDDGYLVDLAEGADIELDPRFGELRNGRVAGGSGSLSVPADEGGSGTEAAGSESSAGAVPASQTCA